MAFKVKFWGVRGSIACPSSKYAIFGGNTSCIEVSCGGQRVILDCGTGIRNLGH
ncbi:MAG: MBL fold metallo-hydrolase, partial [Alphaproteobacteria bacterium]